MAESAGQQLRAKLPTHGEGKGIASEHRGKANQEYGMGVDGSKVREVPRTNERNVLGDGQSQATKQQNTRQFGVNIGR